MNVELDFQLKKVRLRERKWLISHHTACQEAKPLNEVVEIKVDHQNENKQRLFIQGLLEARETTTITCIWQRL